MKSARPTLKSIPKSTSQPTPQPTHGGNLRWAAELVGCLPQDILDFSASINPLGLPDSAIAAIHTTLPTLTAYPDPHYQRLRQAIATHHGIDCDWILPGNGAAELLSLACRELAQHVTALFTPAFADYLRGLAAYDGVVGRLAIADFLTDGHSAVPKSRSLRQRLGNPSGSIALLLNNPHNPTGYLWARSQIQAWIEEADLVIVDEAFMDFLPADRDQTVIEWVQQYPQLVVVRSLTKFYAIPGLRLGYAIAHPDRIKQWQTWRDPWSVNSLATAVGEAVLNDRPYQQRTYEWLAIAKPQLETGLQQLGLDFYPSVSNFLLVKTAQSVPDLQRQLLQRDRILIRNCLSFPELGDRFLRIAVRLVPENHRLLLSLASLINPEVSRKE
ncbi:MAG: threonine-phosphate decarboxylase CobD [Synechococcales bacterium]|nr:threonine-phosphate decarboxylase CobD [Synechococcales bacterium]